MFACFSCDYINSNVYHTMYVLKPTSNFQIVITLVSTSLGQGFKSARPERIIYHLWVVVASRSLRKASVVVSRSLRKASVVVSRSLRKASAWLICLVG